VGAVQFTAIEEELVVIALTLSGAVGGAGYVEVFAYGVAGRLVPFVFVAVAVKQYPVFGSKLPTEADVTTADSSNVNRSAAHPAEYSST